MAGSTSAWSLSLLFGAFFLSGLMQLARSGHEAAASAPVARRIDGQAVDQGVAYVLMLVALLVTYVFH